MQHEAMYRTGIPRESRIPCAFGGARGRRCCSNRQYFLRGWSAYSRVRSERGERGILAPPSPPSPSSPRSEVHRDYLLFFAVYAAGLDVCKRLQDGAPSTIIPD